MSQTSTNGITVQFHVSRAYMRPTSVLTTSQDDSRGGNSFLSFHHPTAPDGLRLPREGIAITSSSPEGVSCANSHPLLFIIVWFFGVCAKLNNLLFTSHSDSYRFSYKTVGLC